MKTNSAQVWQRYADILEPVEEMHPAEFAERYRVMHAVYCSERPGPWDNTVFPYQPHVMNMVEEAIRDGRRGIVLMKAGQIGGTDAMINGMLWLKEYFPGPQLFMSSTEKVASEFGRERFHHIIRDMEPLRKKYIPNKRGDILTKRFVDGKIQLSGGQSVFNLQSTPYRVVVIDELDSLAENLGGEGDPVKLAEVRTDSFTGQTLMIAYAHPTTSDRGSAKLYYENSDQRRGFVKHDCGAEFYLQWEHVKPLNGEKDADGYRYVCPTCGAEISDAERAAMVRAVQYRSVLAPEVAKSKAWIGAHASQLYSPAKSIRSFALRWIDCGDDENAKRVFFNKVLGEPYDPKVQKVDIEAMRSLIVVKRRQNDPEFYLRGQVPPGVRFLTAGQDSRTVELHYAIWGWGLRRAVDKTVALCGWLIDWGCIKREYSINFTESEFHVFDELIYRRTFESTTGDRTFNVMQGGHDIGYPPTQIPIIRYCRNWNNRAIPVKGASVDATSKSQQPYARWGTALKHKAGETAVEDSTSRHLLFNTYMLKTDLFGWIEAGKKLEIPDVSNGMEIGTRKVARLTLPEDVDELFMEQSKNESLVKGKRSNELVWEKTGPNHYADCNTYALGLAYNIDPFQKNQTVDEYRDRRKMIRPDPVTPRAGSDPAMG